jgi:hypothetical protein
VLRRRYSSGSDAHPATAPAGSNRSSQGGNELAEAFRETVTIPRHISTLPLSRSKNLDLA